MVDTTHWEHFPHDADMGVRGFGPTKEEAFSQAAIAMTAVICDPSQVFPTEEIDLACEAPDDELLFVDWLNALIYEMDTRKMLFCRFQVTISGIRLTAKAWGEPVNVSVHQPAVEVKGATYTELSVRRDSAGEWCAQCVVDV